MAVTPSSNWNLLIPNEDRLSQATIVLSVRHLQKEVECLSLAQSEPFPKSRVVIFSWHLAEGCFWVLPGLDTPNQQPRSKRGLQYETFNHSHSPMLKHVSQRFANYPSQLLWSGFVSASQRIAVYLPTHFRGRTSLHHSSFAVAVSSSSDS